MESTKPAPGQPGFKTHTDRRIEIGQDLNATHAAALAYAQNTNPELALGVMTDDYQRAFRTLAPVIKKLSREFREQAEKE